MRALWIVGACALLASGLPMTAAAAERWDDSLRGQFEYLILMDGKVVGGVGKVKGLSRDAAGGEVEFIDVRVFDKRLENFIQGKDQTKISFQVRQLDKGDRYATIASFELQELTLLRYSPGLVANVEHPETLKFTFTVSPGYVKIAG